MKLTISFLLFHLFIFTTTLSHLSAASGIIRDSSGNKLLRGTPYYILPLLRGSGGGLTISHHKQTHHKTKKTSCQLNITQESFEVNNGTPFIFTPIILDEQIIRGAYPISIEANVTNPCQSSNIWKLTSPIEDNDKKKKKKNLNYAKKKRKDDDDDDDDDDYDDDDDDDDEEDDDEVDESVFRVTTGGKFNKPKSCFQIVEDNVMPGLKSYQIQHCPFKCSMTSKDLTCYNIGIVRDVHGKGKVLGRTDVIFPVVFANTVGKFSESGSAENSSEFSAQLACWPQ